MFSGSEYEELLNNEVDTEENNIARNLEYNFVTVFEQKKCAFCQSEGSQHNKNTEKDIFHQRFYIYVTTGFSEHSIPVQEVIG